MRSPIQYPDLEGSVIALNRPPVRFLFSTQTWRAVLLLSTDLQWDSYSLPQTWRAVLLLSADPLWDSYSLSRPGGQCYCSQQTSSETPIQYPDLEGSVIALNRPPVRLLFSKITFIYHFFSRIQLTVTMWELCKLASSFIIKTKLDKIWEVDFAGL